MGFFSVGDGGFFIFGEWKSKVIRVHCRGWKGEKKREGKCMIILIIQHQKIYMDICADSLVKIYSILFSILYNAIPRSLLWEFKQNFRVDFEIGKKMIARQHFFQTTLYMKTHSFYW
jgi:hypothetical protein